jgi:hypothetical protein
MYVLYGFFALPCMQYANIVFMLSIKGEHQKIDVGLKNLIHVVSGWVGKIPGKFYYPTSIFFVCMKM